MFCFVAQAIVRMLEILVTVAVKWLFESLKRWVQRSGFTIHMLNTGTNWRARKHILQRDIPGADFSVTRRNLKTFGSARIWYLLLMIRKLWCWQSHIRTILVWTRIRLSNGRVSHWLLSTVSGFFQMMRSEDILSWVEVKALGRGHIQHIKKRVKAGCTGSKITDPDLDITFSV